MLRKVMNDAGAEFEIEIEIAIRAIASSHPAPAGEFVALLHDLRLGHKLGYREADRNGWNIDLIDKVMFKAAEMLSAAPSPPATADELARLMEALRPFAGAVFNDNGDMTIDRSAVTHDDFERAYFAFRAALSTAKVKGG